jgi:undecaprenyl-diphosphatase
MGRAWLGRMAEQGFVMVAIATAMLALLAKVGEDVFEHESTPFDNAVHAWVVAHQNPALFHVSFIISWLGSSGPVIAGALIVAVWLWRRGGRGIAAMVAASAVTATAIFLIIKQFFHRVRPPGAIRLHIVTYAFPSGHSTTSAAIFVTVAYILVREKLMSRRAGTALAVIGPLLIGLSRVYLDVHWATDVLGGWAAGLLVAALSAALYERLRLTRPARGGDAGSAG